MLTSIVWYQRHKLFLCIVFSVLCTTITLFLGGCGDPPHIETCKADPPTILSNGTTSLSASLSKNDPVTFAWRQLKPKNPLGKFSPRTGSKVNFRAPAADEDTSFKLQVTVADTKGQSSTCDILVEVKKEKVKTWADIGELFSKDKPEKQKK